MAKLASVSLSEILKKLIVMVQYCFSLKFTAVSNTVTGMFYGLTSRDWILQLSQPVVITKYGTPKFPLPIWVPRGFGISAVLRTSGTIIYQNFIIITVSRVPRGSTPKSFWYVKPGFNYDTNTSININITVARTPMYDPCATLHSRMCLCHSGPHALICNLLVEIKKLHAYQSLMTRSLQK